MSKRLDTDTKVVQMRFDNSKFQRNINKTIKSVNELDKSLEFKEGKDGLKDVSKALDEIDLKKRNKELEKSESIVHKITVGLGSLIKIKILSRALDTVINKTSAFVKNLTGINNVVAGWQQYEDQITNVGGILNQVAKDGYGLNDVADAMERLQWYTDETSFSFTTLSNGIRQFTVAGIDLNKATEAAMGVTNLAGSAKVFDEFKVQSGMDAVSKAMQQGYMDTMKWTSLTNTAGIVTKDFTELLLEEAAAQGKLIKSEAGQYKTRKKGTLVTQDNIRNTLSEKWLTSDILANTLNRYSSASSAVQDFMNAVSEGSNESLGIVNELLKDSGKQFQSFDDLLKEFPDDINANNLTARRAIDVLQQLGYQFDEIGLAAFKSSQETTSFSQAIKATKDAIKTGWASIFQSIFGDYEQATALWSDVSDMLYDIFVEPMNNLKDTFKEWSELESGGLQDVHEVIKSIIEIVGLFKSAVSDAFSAVFGEANADIIATIVLRLKQFTQNIKNNERIFKTVTAVAKVFFTILKVIGKVLGAIFKIAGKLLTAMSPLFDLIVDGFVRAVDGIVAFVDWLDELGVLDAIIRSITAAINWLVGSIQKLVGWIKGRVDLEKVTISLGKAIDWLGKCFRTLGDWITSCWKSVKTWWQESEIAQKITDGFTIAINWLREAFEKLKKPFSDIINYFKEFSFLEALVHAFERMKEVGKHVWGWFTGIWGKIIKFLQDTGVLEKIIKFWNKVKEVFNWIKDALVGFFNKMKEYFADKSFEEILKSILKAMGILFAIVLAIQFLGIIVRWKWVLDSISTMFYGFAAKMKAEAVKSIGFALVELAASLWIFVKAIQELDKIDWKKSWKSVLVMTTFLTIFLSALIILTRVSKELKGSLRASIQIITFVGALMLLILVVKKMLTLVSGIDVKELWSIIKIVSALSIVIGITFALIKIPGKTPLLISFAKIILAMWVLLKVVFWVFKKVADSNISPTDALIASIIIETAVRALWAILLAFKMYKIKSIFVKGLGRISANDSKRIAVSISGVAGIILAGVLVMKLIKNMSIGDIAKGGLAIFLIITNVALIATAMAFLGKIKINQNSNLMLNGINKSLLSIAMTILIMVFITKMLKGINSYTLGSTTATLLTMFFVVGLIAVGLNATSKVINKTKNISKSGVSLTGGKNNSITGMLLSITITVLAFIGISYLLKAIPIKDIYKTGWKIFGIFAALAAISAGVQIASKFANKGSIISATVFISVLVGLVAGVLGLTRWVNHIGGDALVDGLFCIGLIIAGLLGTLYLLGKLTKSAGFDTKQVVLMLVLIAGIEVIVAGCLGLIKIVDNLNKNNTNWAVGFGVIIGIISIFAIVAMIMSKIEINTGAVVSMITIMLTFTLCILILSGVLTIISKIPEDAMKRSAVVIGIFAGVLLLIITVLLLIISKMKADAVGKLNATFLAISLLFIAVSVAMLLIAAALTAIANIPEKDCIRAAVIMGILLAVIGIIMVALTAIAVGTGGVGAAIILAIAAAFVAVGLAAVLLASSIVILAKGVDNLVKVLSNVTPAIIGQAVELGIALIALGAANLTSGILNLAGSVMNLGAAIVDNISSAINVVTEFNNTLATGLKALGEWATGAAEASKVKNMSKALNELDIEKLNAFNAFIDGLYKLKDIGSVIDEVNSRINDFTAMMEQLSTAASGAGISTSLLQFMQMLSYLSMIPKETLDSLTLVMTSLNSILEQDINIEPKITPIFDFTAFDEGITHMRGQLDSVGLTNTTDIAYSAKSSADQSSRGFFSGFADTLKSMIGGFGANKPVQIIQNFTDSQMYGFNASRGVANIVGSAVSSVLSKRR